MAGAGPPYSTAKRWALSRRLLAWYDRARRKLPWRAAPGERPDPYRVWLAEIMLQQTTVAAVAPYFARFLARFPTVEALAKAPLDRVLHAWQGLGYYARARHLHRAAGIVWHDLGGRVPDTEEGLRALPGIGPYTAAAVAAIAFNRPAVPVDGNVERVLSRLFAVTEPLPKAKPRLRDHAASFASAHRPGDLAQAMMDLGATICTPRSPRCDVCPWRMDCRARALGIVADLPARKKAMARPRRYGIAFWVERERDGAILLRRRDAQGLLGGMMEVPCTPFRAEPFSDVEAARFAPAKGRWRVLPGNVRHVFTHFDLEVTLRAARVAARAKADGEWVRPSELARFALPTLMKKIIRHAGAAEQAAGLRPPSRSRRGASGAARRSARNPS